MSRLTRWFLYPLERPERIGVYEVGIPVIAGLLTPPNNAPWYWRFSYWNGHSFSGPAADTSSAHMQLNGVMFGLFLWRGINGSEGNEP